MTEDFRMRVLAMYEELKFIVGKDPNAQVGAPTIQSLKYLITKAKDAGADAKMCDMMLGTLNMPTGATLSASDAFVIAGQAVKLVE